MRLTADSPHPSFTCPSYEPSMLPAGQIAVPLEPAGAPLPRPVSIGAPWRADPYDQALFVRVHDPASIPAQLAEDWKALADAAAEPNSFAEHWFVAASLAAFGAERQIRLVEVRRGPELIGVLPLAVESGYAHLSVRFVQNWCHHHLFLGTPLVRHGDETDFWSAVLDQLDRAGWVPNLLHLRGLVEDGPVHRGLATAAALRGRGCATVHRESRALLAGSLDPDAYYRATIRPKKRKEIRRLRARLTELGELRVSQLEPGEPLEPWCDLFLALEASGWKGRGRSALACDPRTDRFFRDALAGAHEAGKLQFLRLDVGGRPIAMLVNFLAPPGGFSFKTCFDEDYARFSPGVLIQLENLGLMARTGLDWMDSCASEHHPMIDGLWSGRRSLVRVTVRLGGLRRSLVFAGCRALETGSAFLRWLARGRAA